MSQVFRIFEPCDFKQNTNIEFSEDAHHILYRVLRKERGEPIVLLNGSGQIAQATISQLDKRNGSATIESITHAQPPKPEIRLFIGSLKGEKLSWVVQKSTELGVAEIVIFQSEHSIAIKSENFIEKTNKIAIESIRQSGNPFLPKLRHIKNLLEIKKDTSSAHLNVVLDETETCSFQKIMKSAPFTSVSLFVGPEGGFSPLERDFFRENNYLFVKIAPYILRSDTAAIAAVALFRASFA
jgi:16S rRNA (uracil1498-N3)-methyltransferase